jgi:tripartite-type tricarboxylate transporter receptor subunit TctC
MNRRHILSRAAAAAAAGLLGAGNAFAQLLQKTSRIVVGFPAGGTTDVFARLMAERLRGSLAPTVLVENKPGAAGRLALMNAATNDADGSVSFIVPCSLMFIYPYVYKKLGYDPVKDFTPVASIANGEFALSVGPMVPESVKTLADFIAWLKANPKQAFFASPAAGATPHFVGLMFAKAAGVEMTHASYRGDAPGIQDLLGGQVACSVNNIGVILPHVKSGRLRVLATSGAKRSRYLPNVPTFAEAGFRDVQAREWFGVFVPAKVPQAMVDGMAKSLEDAIAQADSVKKIEEFSFEPEVIKGQAFATLMAKERERWASVVKSSGFQIDE